MEAVACHTSGNTSKDLLYVNPAKINKNLLINNKTKVNKPSPSHQKTYKIETSSMIDRLKLFLPGNILYDQFLTVNILAQNPSKKNPGNPLFLPHP